MMEIISGSILDSKEQYICHQINCVSTKAAFLAKEIFLKFPHSDVYSQRTTRDIPGNIIVRGDGCLNRLVIGILGQVYPGKPSNKLDDKEARVIYFEYALDKIKKIKDLKSIAFPFGIGCGAAKGDWSIYSQMIEEFSKNIDCKIYKI